MSDLLARLQTALGQGYQVEREIGRGGMAIVYLATDLKHKRSVAIKVLHPDLAAAVGHERFLREIEIAAKLQHPHILPVYDSGDAEGLLYYVMPFVEGESLRDRIERQGALAAEEALRITGEVADALDYAHRQGIVHRDIKPANILLSQGHAQVADFGIARAISVSGGAGLTQAGMALGTPSYMSPEQALGETELDGRTDVYALGCVLYEMLAGGPPYEGTTPQAIVAKAISAETPKLDADPARIQPIIERAMAKQPADRFQTAGTLGAALRTGTTSGGARTPWWALAAGGVAAVLVIFGVMSLWPRGWGVEGDPRHSLIVFPFENRTGDADKAYLEEAAMNLLGLAAAQWEDMRVFDDERTGSLMRRRGVESAQDIDFDAAQAMAKDARVGTFLLGDIRRDGDSLAIEAKVHDVVSGDRLATEIVRAAYDADPRPLFDALAARVLQISGAPDGERPDVVAQTTHSLEAYRAYLRGAEALHQLEIDTAQAYLLRAIELDSTFALAYMRLRDVDGWIGVESNPELRREWTAKAQAYSATLPPRLRTLVQFHAAYESGEYSRARQLVEGLIARDSADAEAWYQLGEAHFHDNAGGFPHADTVGNIGKALRAFERTLILDPRYTLAYQHILDALRMCRASNPFVCLADSAVYASQPDLAARFGSDRVQTLRDEARDGRLAAAYRWVDAAPRSTRARFELVRLLFDSERPDEARTQIAALRANGEHTPARIFYTGLALREARYGEAADSMIAALEDRAGAFRLLLGGDGPDIAFISLIAGGRIAASEQLSDDLMGFLSQTSQVVNGPGGVPFPASSLVYFIEMQLEAEIGNDPEATRTTVTAWLNVVDSLFARDSTNREEAYAGTGSSILTAYLGTRDTTILARFLEVVDTTQSRTWRAMEAHLALARGDTARAQARIDRRVRNADSLEFAGEPGEARAFAWADLLTQLGSVAEAISVYGHLDSSNVRTEHAGLHVRSFAERGALYQQLGDTDQALEMYERFIEAWERADLELQPLVDRARDAVAALRGEVRETERR